MSALGLSQDRKMELFMEGWNEYAADLLMPSAFFDKAERRFFTWEELVAGKTAFECKQVGRAQGKEYADNVNFTQDEA